MSDAKRDFGVWAAIDASHPECPFWYIKGPNGYVAMLNVGGCDDVGQGAKDLPSIAHLIAAAPDLLAALIGCVEHMEHSTPQGRAAWATAHTAIAKAKGAA